MLPWSEPARSARNARRVRLFYHTIRTIGNAAMNLDHGDTRLLIDACRSHGLLRNQAAYVLGTAKHETAGTMKPVRETLAKSDAGAMAALTKAWKSGRLSWVKKDYWSSGFFGRGYVQLTHEANYRFAGEQLGI